jgi:hypothetical protein
MADRSLAQQILAATCRLKHRVLPVHSPRGLVAVPVFHDVSIGTIEHLLDATDLSPQALTQRLATPQAWACGSSRAATAQLALAVAEKARARAIGATAEAVASTQALGLRTLIGTPAQLAWAHQIRAKHAEALPDSVHLRTKPSAAWWIKNRHSL